MDDIDDVGVFHGGGLPLPRPGESPEQWSALYQALAALFEDDGHVLHGRQLLLAEDCTLRHTNRPLGRAGTGTSTRTQGKPSGQGACREAFFQPVRTEANQTEAPSVPALLGKRLFSLQPGLVWKDRGERTRGRAARAFLEQEGLVRPYDTRGLLDHVRQALSASTDLRLRLQTPRLAPGAEAGARSALVWAHLGFGPGRAARASGAASGAGGRPSWFGPSGVRHRAAERGRAFAAQPLERRAEAERVRVPHPAGDRCDRQLRAGWQVRRQRHLPLSQVGHRALRHQLDEPLRQRRPGHPRPDRLLRRRPGVRRVLVHRPQGRPRHRVAERPVPPRRIHLGPVESVPQRAHQQPVQHDLLARPPAADLPLQVVAHRGAVLVVGDHEGRRKRPQKPLRQLRTHVVRRRFPWCDRSLSRA